MLCVGCDRPRGCNNALSMSSDASLQKDTWVCQACTLQNSSSAVLCAVCDRPRLAGKPSRDGHDSTALSLMNNKDTKDFSKTAAILDQSRLMSLSENSKTTLFGSMYDKAASLERTNQMSLSQVNNNASLPYSKKSILDNSYKKPLNELRSSLEKASEPLNGGKDEQLKMSKVICSVRIVICKKIDTNGTKVL